MYENRAKSDATEPHREQELRYLPEKDPISRSCRPSGRGATFFYAGLVYCRPFPPLSCFVCRFISRAPYPFHLHWISSLAFIFVRFGATAGLVASTLRRYISPLSSSAPRTLFILIEIPTRSNRRCDISPSGDQNHPRLNQRRLRKKSPRRFSRYLSIRCFLGSAMLCARINNVLPFFATDD